MADDSLLHDFARQSRLRFKWRTWKKGTHWHASVKAWKGDKVVGWYGANGIGTEQEALNSAIRHLIDGYEKPDYVESVNLTDPHRDSYYRRRRQG